MLYIAHSSYGIHRTVYARRFGRPISSFACSIYGFLHLESVMIQVFMCLGTTIVVFCLICRNRHAVLGRFDWRLLVPCSIPTLGVLVVAAVTGQIQQNEA